MLLVFTFISSSSFAKSDLVELVKALHVKNQVEAIATMAIKSRVEEKRFKQLAKLNDVGKKSIEKKVAKYLLKVYKRRIKFAFSSEELRLTLNYINSPAGIKLLKVMGKQVSKDKKLQANLDKLILGEAKKSKLIK